MRSSSTELLGRIFYSSQDKGTVNRGQGEGRYSARIEECIFSSDTQRDKTAGSSLQETGYISRRR